MARRREATGQTGRSDTAWQAFYALPLPIAGLNNGGMSNDMPCLDLGPAQIMLQPGEAFVGYQLMAQQIRPQKLRHVHRLRRVLARLHSDPASLRGAFRAQLAVGFPGLPAANGGGPAASVGCKAG